MGSWGRFISTPCIADGKRSQHFSLMSTAQLGAVSAVQGPWQAITGPETHNGPT